MGNFILFHKNRVIDYDSVYLLKRKMSLSEPIRVSCNDYEIWLFNNHNLKNSPNTLYEEGKDWIFAAGTFFYKNYSYANSNNFLEPIS